MPSSALMVRRVASKFDFSRPLVIAEYGPGEGCHTRKLLSKLHPQSRLLLFELNSDFCKDLEKQFADDPRVEVINGDAQTLSDELAKRNIKYCDYVLSGIPFSILPLDQKRELLKKTHSAIRPGGAFVIYQVTNELKQHALAKGLFDRAEGEYFLFNVPPMFIVVFHKDAVEQTVSETSKNGSQVQKVRFKSQSKRSPQPAMS